MSVRLSLPFLLAALVTTGCGDDDGTIDPVDGGPTDDSTVLPDADPGAVPATYTFPSRFGEGSGVAYTGQTTRQILMGDMKTYLGGLTDDVDTNGAPATGEVVDALGFYYDFDSSTGGTVALLLTTDPPAEQTTYADLGSGNLATKIAGMDAANMHRDWSTAFAGWTGAASPHGLVQGWFQDIEDLAVARAGINPPLDPFGQPISKVFIDEQGRDYQQLLQKFLSVAVAFSQGTDDYLDEGLEVSNLQDGDKAYSSLEHHWDEGFGYFGAARDYNDYTDDEIASTGYMDSDSSASIDLLSEYNFGHSTNAAKRDRGSADAARTDFTKAIFDAFLMGRWIIWSAEGELTTAQVADLEAQRDIIALNWEKAIAATVVHYINDVLELMNSADFTDANNYDFAGHAKAWSELKGFALGFQFNPRSPMLDDFEEFHTLVGDAPVLPDAGTTAIDAYKADLLAARALLKDAYGFDAANMGDGTGAGGW